MILSMRYVSPSLRGKRAVHTVTCPSVKHDVRVQQVNKRSNNDDTCHGCDSFRRQGWDYIECAHGQI